RSIQTPQDRHERRFPGAGGTDNRHELAALDGEADPSQRLNVNFAQTVGSGDGPHVDHSVRHTRAPLSLMVESRSDAKETRSGLARALDIAATLLGHNDPIAQ